jgi:hypothetical protein
VPKTTPRTRPTFVISAIAHPTGFGTVNRKVVPDVVALFKTRRAYARTARFLTISTSVREIPRVPFFPARINHIRWFSVILSFKRELGVIIIVIIRILLLLLLLFSLQLHLHLLAVFFHEREVLPVGFSREVPRHELFQSLDVRRF